VTNLRGADKPARSTPPQMHVPPMQSGATM